MSTKKQLTIEEMKKAMAIEILPVKDLKKPAEIPVDFTTLIQKGYKIRYTKAKERQEINPALNLVCFYY